MNMSNPKLSKTSYNRKSCNIGVVHLGFGAFHRAHQAVYIDDYMELTGDMNWGIAAVNLRRNDSVAFEEASSVEDGYVVKVIDFDDSTMFRLSRSHIKFVDAVSQPEDAYDLFSLHTVKMVTLTVTESGYYFGSNWRLDTTAEPISSGLSGSASETVYAFLAKALDRRAKTINEPLTLLSCDNIRSNGRILESALLEYLELNHQESLAKWVRENVTFPCSMVDRITPQTTLTLQNEITQLFPRHSIAPVHAETFSQWVIENKFAAAMPDLCKVGVQIVSDVEPYEEAKIRILNGGHSGLAYLGALAGHQTFDQVMSDPELRPHFDRWEKQEVLCGLGDSIPFDVMEYLNKIVSRFENKGIADNLERICMDGYSKMAIYIQPTLEACLQKGILPEAGFDCVAAWVINSRRVKNHETTFPYHEPNWERLSPMLTLGREEEIASDSQIWGDLPQRFEHFVPSLVQAIKRMEQKWHN